MNLIIKLVLFFLIFIAQSNGNDYPSQQELDFNFSENEVNELDNYACLLYKELQYSTSHLSQEKINELLQSRREILDDELEKVIEKNLKKSLKQKKRRTKKIQKKEFTKFVKQKISYHCDKKLRHQKILHAPLYVYSIVKEAFEVPSSLIIGFFQGLFAARIEGNMDNSLSFFYQSSEDILASYLLQRALLLSNIASVPTYGLILVQLVIDSYIRDNCSKFSINSTQVKSKFCEDYKKINKVSLNLSTKTKKAIKSLKIKIFGKLEYKEFKQIDFDEMTSKNFCDLQSQLRQVYLMNKKIFTSNQIKVK
ncbi:hypothetical protein N9N67_03860, partial [Bacteriovoracaceae bacterium]|nr:hypothetical protein [Bacteriovoracaceae bacterium]